MKNKTSRQIADSLIAMTDDYLSDAIDITELSMINKSMWREAFDLGLQEEVDKLVNEPFMLEMQEIIKNLNFK